MFFLRKGICLSIQSVNVQLGQLHVQLRVFPSFHYCTVHCVSLGSGFFFRKNQQKQLCHQPSRQVQSRPLEIRQTSISDGPNSASRTLFFSLLLVFMQLPFFVSSLWSTRAQRVHSSSISKSSHFFQGKFRLLFVDLDRIKHQVPYLFVVFDCGFVSIL